jgi:hypothetical protein
MMIGGKNLNKADLVHAVAMKADMTIKDAIQ